MNAHFTDARREREKWINGIRASIEFNLDTFFEDIRDQSEPAQYTVLARSMDELEKAKSALVYAGVCESCIGEFECDCHIGSMGDTLQNGGGRFTFTGLTENVRKFVGRRISTQWVGNSDHAEIGRPAKFHVFDLNGKGEWFEKREAQS